VDKIPLISTYIVKKKLNNIERVNAALTYLLAHANDIFNIRNFEEFCGIGIVISPEQIEKEVERIIKIHEDEILEKR